MTHKRGTLPDGYTSTEGEPVEIFRLSTPIPGGEGEITELRLMRRLNADDLIVVEERNLEGTHANLHTAYRLTGISVGSLRRMDAHDARRLEVLLAGFLRTGPGTGGPDSPSSRLDSAGARESSTD